MSIAEPLIKSNWLVRPRDPIAEVLLQRELGLRPLVSALLVQRGFADPREAELFLRSSLEDFHDPALLPDYGAARDAILGAKERGETIFVHGDYDVDGVTSAAIFDRFLTKIGCNVKTHVPHRMREGYGIHTTAVDEAIAEGAKLFLTCDCGSAAFEQIRKAREAGMTVVVTDHHTIGEEFPEAHAFVNPHRTDSTYPFKELSGAGVAFKLCAGLTREVGHDPKHFYRAYLDLAVLGTVADVMPLVGENRIIAKHGLVQLQETKKPGLEALMEIAEIDRKRPLGNGVIGFVLGPRLNATGRIDDAAISLRLLLEKDPAAAKTLAAEVDKLNRERKAEQERVCEEAIEIAEQTGAAKNWVVVVCKEGWHSGIVGIVASRLVEHYHRPAFVLTRDPYSGLVKGSGRSIAGFHLADSIRAHPELFRTGGGHAMAAGCSFDGENLEAVREALHEDATKVLQEEDLVPTIAVDLEIGANELSLSDCDDFQRLQPFGVANPEPTLVARNVTIIELKPCRNPSHMQLKLRQEGGPPIKSIAFNLGERLAEFESGDRMDFLFRAEEDDWNGRRIQWKVADFWPSDAI